MAVTRVRDANPLAPIQAALRRLATRPGIPPLSGLEPGLVVTDPTGWVPATDLVSGGLLDDLLETAARRWQASPHAAAALAFKHYASWLALPAVLGYATVRRVPLLSPETVLLRWSAGAGPFLRIGLVGGQGGRRGPAWMAVLPTDALPPDAGIRVVPHEAALLDELRTALTDEHLTPLLGHIRQRTHLGRRTLWGSLASGIAHGLSRAADVIPGPTLPVAEAVLGALGVADLVEIASSHPGGELTVQRRTCCLAFTLPEPHHKVCAGCCIR